MRERNGRSRRGMSGRLGAPSNLSRRELLQRSAAVGAGAALLPRLGGGLAAQEEIPREPSTATLDGPLQVLLKDDFHPDHNAFMRAELEAYAAASGWEIEITDVAGYQGGGDLFQKLLGGVQADDAPDLVIHDLGVRNFVTLGLVQPIGDLVAEMTELYGEPIPGAVFDSTVDEEWYAVPFFTRANGYYVRQDVFTEHGLDVVADTETYEQMRESALAVSNPDENMWGWGVSVNRSGDGESLVRNVLFRYGSQLQDETGQLVTFNSPETIAGLDWLKETYTAEQYAPMLPPGVLSWTDTSNNEAFLAGQIAVTQNAGTMYAKAVLDQVPFADQIAYVPWPARVTDGARIDFMSGGMKFYAITGSPNTEAVHDVARHFLTVPVKERVWSISTAYALPAYRAGWDNPIITENENSMRAKDISLNETDFYGIAWPGPVTEAIGSIDSGTYYTDMMSEIIQGRDTAEVVADYHDQFVQIFQDFGFDGE